MAAAATFAAAAASGISSESRTAQRKSIWSSASGRRTSMALVHRLMAAPRRYSSGTSHPAKAGGTGQGGETSSDADETDSMVINTDDADWDATTDDGFEDLLEHPVVSEFLSELRTLYAMLYSLAAFPATAYFENERTEAALTLVSFLRRTHRDDIFTKYVHFLEEVHR